MVVPNVTTSGTSSIQLRLRRIAAATEGIPGLSLNLRAVISQFVNQMTMHSHRTLLNSINPHSNDFKSAIFAQIVNQIFLLQFEGCDSFVVAIRDASG